MKNLRDEVQAWLNDYEIDERKTALEDLLQHGCSSGMVSSLIYYDDTVAFYERHIVEINETLAEMLAETGAEHTAQLLRDWDSADPLALDTNNRNLLAWFGFESAALRLQDQFAAEV